MDTAFFQELYAEATENSGGELNVQLFLDVMAIPDVAKSHVPAIVDFILKQFRGRLRLLLPCSFVLRIICSLLIFKIWLARSLRKLRLPGLKFLVNTLQSYHVQTRKGTVGGFDTGTCARGRRLHTRL
jgi:hypothetical protein